MASEAAETALSILRNASMYKWYVIPFLLVVIYLYAAEAEKKNWKGIMAGIAFWGIDLFNEIWNSLILHFTGYSAFWLEPGETAYLILVSLNIETSLMFAVMGLASAKFLPANKDMKVFGKTSNRIVIALIIATLCLFVEILLNIAGALVWDYPFWSLACPWLILVVAYFPMWFVTFKVFDARDMKRRVKMVGTIFIVDLACVVVFIGILGWI